MDQQPGRVLDEHGVEDAAALGCLALDESGGGEYSKETDEAEAAQDDCVFSHGALHIQGLRRRCQGATLAGTSGAP